MIDVYFGSFSSIYRLSSSHMLFGSSWGESTISRRFKVDNDILEHEPELAKLMFDKSTGLNKQDIDRIAASATHLDIPIWTGRIVMSSRSSLLLRSPSPRLAHMLCRNDWNKTRRRDSRRRQWQYRLQQ
jgi:hypothetical protein